MHHPNFQGKKKTNKKTWINHHRDAKIHDLRVNQDFMGNHLPLLPRNFRRHLSHPKNWDLALEDQPWNPGRLMAGTYSHHPFIKENDLPKPPWLYSMLIFLGV